MPWGFGLGLASRAFVSEEREDRRCFLSASCAFFVSAATSLSISLLRFSSHPFGSQSPGGTNPQQLAHGISVALYNTAFGIAISIPSLIFYRHFKNKVDTLVVEMEEQAAKLVDMVHGERVG